MTTATKERPILFSAPMVRAILEGRKTMTRRVIKPQPTIDSMGNLCWKGSCYGQRPDGQPRLDAIRCPYGKPGDRLWVRETWQAVERESDGLDGVLFKADNDFIPIKNTPEAAELWMDSADVRPDALWKPSIFMPRWASRILLEVTEVRAERLQEISEDDAIAEGAELAVGRTNPKHPFRDLWDRINFDRGHGWMTDPWVWVVSFKVLSTTGGEA